MELKTIPPPPKKKREESLEKYMLGVMCATVLADFTERREPPLPFGLVWIINIVHRVSG